MAFLSTGFMLWKSNTVSSSSKYRNITMVSSNDVEAIKDVLQTQQQLLIKLYGELDEERELSSCAADEAMAMIVRLQAEKAKLKMEANQYRREAEERMCQAEETLVVFEDLIDQKEAEIAYLDFQVEFFRNKLISMGYVDLTIPEFEHLYLPDQRVDINVVNEYTNSSDDRKRKTVEIKKSLIPMIPKRGGASVGKYKKTGFANRPVRSCSVPPPETEGSSLSVPIGV